MTLQVHLEHFQLMTCMEIADKNGGSIFGRVFWHIWGKGRKTYWTPGTG
jgi:hypothetical protein